MRPEKWFLNEFCLISLLFISFCTSTDIITPTNSITGDQILLSSGQKFALGFFSPGNSSHLYLGIWFYKIPEAQVWVANRDNPIETTNSSSVVLTINSQGNLVILDGNTNKTVWSSNVLITGRNNNLIGKLLDTGNLVLTHEGSETVVWESFDYPTDTALPGMKMGLDLKRGLNRSLTSWKSRDDPGRGNYSFVLEPRGSPQLFLYKGSDRLWRSGPWNGLRMSDIPELTPESNFKDDFVNTADEIYMTQSVSNSSIITRFVVVESGSIQKQIWIEETRQWNIIWSNLGERCDKYASCGANSSCNLNYPTQCSCLPGFEPKSPRDWNSGVGSEGCVRKRQGQCEDGDGFLKLLRVKVPDTSVSRVDMSLSLEECKQECLKNCSCTAWTAADIRGGGSGCLAWFGDLIDLREYPNGGQDLFIRADAVELAANASRDSKGSRGKKRMFIILFVSLFGGLFSLVSCGYCLLKKRRKRRMRMGRTKIDSKANNKDENVEDLELPLFQLVTVATATNNFSSANKIGEGGFGLVYKGELSTGQEIAVKKLSKDSGQGLKEFTNEVILIANLQHRNLVKLLGCCIQGEERMLVYEYMPNKSLNSFIFDQTRGTSLTWQRRFDIIVGIARGILYLHRDSRLRIIHRDLKASNILLDNEMNPKISDFGIARIFRVDQTEENTNRVIGTYGYMSPEYAIDGLFSVKSDVFSFGVLVLEIVSGKKNRGFYHPDHDLNLLGHAWKLWNERKPLALLDELIEGPVLVSEALRCIQVGLLCVQQRPEDRPTMPTVLLMLDSENPMLPQPKQPGFYTERFPSETDSSSTGKKSCTTANEITITMLDGR